MIRPVVHGVMHVVVPGLVARWGWPKRWKSVWVAMLLTNLVDLDHLYADPMYDPNRCSLGFHPLHSLVAMFVYLVMTAIPKTRIVGVGLVIHMVLDGIDCIWMRL